MNRPQTPRTWPNLKLCLKLCLNPHLFPTPCSLPTRFVAVSVLTDKLEIQFGTFSRHVLNTVIASQNIIGSRSTCISLTLKCGGEQTLPNQDMIVLCGCTQAAKHDVNVQLIIKSTVGLQNHPVTGLYFRA